MLKKEEVTEIISKYGSNAKDTGRIEVQLAILTKEIEKLTTHMINNKKDKISKRGLYHKVSHRKRLLSYLERTDIERFRNICKELKIRIVKEQ